jgi:uncharacterized protein (TIGR03435 family)
MILPHTGERQGARKRYLLVVRLMLPLGLGFLNSAAGPAQSQTKISFDAASVKVAKPGDLSDDREDIRTSPGTLTMRHVSLKSCIQWAYGLSGFQISGPGWLGSDRFDITAKVANPAKDDQLRLMLQSLLAERFKLALHRDQKEEQVYVLTVSKNGPKFHESKGDGSSRMMPGRFGFTAQRTSMPQLAEYLAIPMRRPVLDRTGLTGRYDFAMDLTPYTTGNAQPQDMAGMVLTAVQDQLGLKLESQKGPLAFLVVEHAERVPTAN